MGLNSILLGAGLFLGAPHQPATAPVANAPLVATANGTGKVFLSKDEALGLAFKDCEIERSTVFLTEDQKAEVDRLAGFKAKVSIAYTYVASRAGKRVGYAWFDASKVRSKKQLVMFSVGLDGEIQRFELLAFGEPSEYIPRSNWYAQLLGKRLDKELKLKKSIKSVTGATLTARATVDAARRVLALQATLFPAPSEPLPATQPGR